MTEKGDTPMATVQVPSKDPVKPNEKQPGLKTLAKKKKNDSEELSEETQKVKEDIELLVSRITDSEVGVATLALQALRSQLQGSTASMASVPLPLKFLRPHFVDLENFYNRMAVADSNKESLSDILSVLATVHPNSERKALKYRLSGTQDGITSWGQEYLQNISTELAAEFEERESMFVEKKTEEGQTKLDTSDLLGLVKQIVPFYFRHHNEIDAIDLLVEVQQIESVLKYVDASNYKRVTNYMMSLSDFSISHEDWINLLSVTYQIFIDRKEYCQALRVALKLNDAEKVQFILTECSDPLIKKQIGYVLGQFQFLLPDAVDECYSTASNEWLSDMYKSLAKDLDVLETKHPEDIFKSSLDEKRAATGFFLDSAKMNLASTFVNAFVNAGFGTDQLMTTEDTSWVFKNRDHGMFSAAASVGAIMLWNVDEGLAQIDKFRWANEPQVNAGALMAFGLVCSGVKNPCDPAFGLLADHLESASGIERDAAILGIGAAHAGWKREELLSLLVPLIIDTALPPETSAMAALSLGLSFIGSSNDSAAEAIIQTLIERQFMSRNLDEPLAFCFPLALGLLYLGQKEASEVSMEALEAVSEHAIGKFATTLVLGCSYVGSGDVTKVQYFLKSCVENSMSTPSEDLTHHEEEKNSQSKQAGDWATSDETKTSSDNPTKTSDSAFTGMYQAAAVFCMTLVALGETCGIDMHLRIMDHLLQYGTPKIRQAVPLALAIAATSNPKPVIVDSLSKLTHDSDSDVAMNATLALGIVGAGTNNAKIAETLRRLAANFYSRDLSGLFCVRIAQGLLYMGKGLLTISPLLSDGFLISPVALSSLLVVILSCLFLKTTILGGFHSLLYFLLVGSRPRMLMTLDENLNPVSVPVRVGQAVDIAGQAGQPRTITGFQTQCTPVLLNAGERAELATDEYQPVASLPLEHVVILRKTVSKDSKI